MGARFGGRAPDKYAWDDKVDLPEIKRMLLEGMSRSEIGRALPVRNGIQPSRNAVIGKIDRAMGKDVPAMARRKPAPPRAKRVPSAKPLPTAVASKPLPPEKPPTVLVRPKADGTEEAIPAGRAAVLSLRHHECKWPFGEPRSEAFRFCCETRLEDRPYCPAHCVEAYVPSKPRTKTYGLRLRTA